MYRDSHLFTAPTACTQVSVVVPAQNEDENVVPLIEEIDKALQGVVEFEMVFVDDGSRDATWARLQEARQRFPHLTILRHAKGSGQSVAIRSGVKAARYPWIATLDGDGQNDPADIPSLIKALGAEMAGGKPVMMAGQRAKRQDTWFRRFSSRVANGVRRFLLNDVTPDTGCGLKLFPRQIFLDMAHFNHLHRFMPALMIRQGGRVVSVPVNHRPRYRGVSKYGLWNRLWVGIVDLFGVMWLMKRPVAPVVTEIEGR
ncbi:MAG: glycosyltransferase family 2 protein [Alphaproteobacteria bacterium]|nr:glycosyltransferase family 2 protein [Alphaproteobacteria bacterium]